MSGADAITVVGLMSAVITIVETLRKLYDASNNAKGLHEAFRDVAQSLPLVLDILRDCHTAQKQVDQKYRVTSDTSSRRELEKSAEAAKTIMEECRNKANALEEIFQKVLPGDDAGRAERYMKAARSLKPGRTEKVEDLMTGIFKQLQILQTSRFFKSELEKRAGDIQSAVDRLSELGPSLPDEGKFVHTGSGALYAHTGSGVQNNYNQSSGERNKQYIGHTMNFGRDSP
jgi:hypothetical protein